MVKHSEIGKTSSEDKNISRRLFERLPKKEQLRWKELQLKSVRSDLLIELANLHDEGESRFWARVREIGGPLLAEDKIESLAALRGELRIIWDSSKSVSDKDQILQTWLTAKSPSDRPSFIARFEKGGITYNPFNLRATLVFAVLERARQLRICANPECPSPYFIAKRVSQKYCERGECTAFAQRQYAIDWWRRNQTKAKKSLRRSK